MNTTSANCKVYSISGQQVYSNNFTGINNSLIEINLENISAGVYFIELVNSNGKQIKKFVKE